MKYFLIIVLLLFSIPVFSQYENETDKLISDVITSNECLGTINSESHIVFNKLRNINTAYLISDCKIEYGIYKYISPSNFIDKISLPLISEEELKNYDAIADSININITDPYKRTNRFCILYEKTHKFYLEFSKPIFSKDHRKAIISIHQCDCYSSSGCLYTYKKSAGKWIPDSFCGGYTDD